MTINNKNDSKRQQTVTVDYKRLLSFFFYWDVVILRCEKGKWKWNRDYIMVEAFMDIQNDLAKYFISETEKEEFNERIMNWLSDENLEKAKGKSRQAIFMEFDCKIPQPIAYIPEKYLALFDEKMSDNRVYSSQAYFIDHAVNNHPNLDKERYLLIQDVLDNPDEIKTKNRMPAKNTKAYGLYHRRAAFPPSSMPKIRHTAAAFLLVTTMQN